MLASGEYINDIQYRSRPSTVSQSPLYTNDDNDVGNVKGQFSVAKIY